MKNFSTILFASLVLVGLICKANATTSTASSTMMDSTTHTKMTHSTQKMTHSTYKHMTHSTKMHSKYHTSMMSKMMSYMKTAEKDKLNGSSFIAFQLMPLALAVLCSIKMQFY